MVNSLGNRLSLDLSLQVLGCMKARSSSLKKSLVDAVYLPHLYKYQHQVLSISFLTNAPFSFIFHWLILFPSVYSLFRDCFIWHHRARLTVCSHGEHVHTRPRVGNSCYRGGEGRLPGTGHWEVSYTPLYGQCFHQPFKSVQFLPFLYKINIVFSKFEYSP